MYLVANQAIEYMAAIQLPDGQQIEGGEQQSEKAGKQIWVVEHLMIVGDAVALIGRHYKSLGKGKYQVRAGAEIRLIAGP